MKRIDLVLDPSGATTRTKAIVAWTLFVGLLVVLLAELHLGRSLDRQLVELSAPGAGSGASRVPTSSEIERVALLQEHATVRFADWTGAFTALSGALPAGVSVERVSLNARTGKGDAVVRMTRVTDATKVVESLSARDTLRAPVVRRCDQAAASDHGPVRCELEVTWQKVTR